VRVSGEGVVRHAVRPGVYLDSVVLLDLQRRLLALPGVLEAGAAMATAGNRELLAQRGLLPAAAAAARPDDLLLAVRAASAAQAEAALGEVDALLAARRPAAAGERRPRGLAAALRERPEAGWVLVSVPGRHAAAVAREALAAGRSVFLFSDNVAVADEVALKAEAGRRGLLLLGPDCGTALIGGVGLGFANRVRPGGVGIVGASGTGIQLVASAVHRLGAGVSHAIGVGGRDLSREVGGAATRPALAALAADPATRVVVLISKPPAPEVAAPLLAAAAGIGKPVVVAFLGQPAPPGAGPLRFARSLDEAAVMAVEALGGEAPARARETRPAAAAPAAAARGARAGGVVRGLFAGGTLAAEALLALGDVVHPVRSNLIHQGPLALGAGPLPAGHVVLDLGADEHTAGRPHPMLDPALRVPWLADAAADPTVRAVLLDLVLGDGGHPDPAAVLAPAIASARAVAASGGRELAVVVLLVGTDLDPQGLAAQEEALAAAGATVVETLGAALAACASALGLAAPAADAAGAAPRREPATTAAPAGALPTAAAPDAAPLPAPPPLRDPLASGAINVGLEGFHDALLAQGVASLHVDWRPPAGGDARLAGLLARMRG
jgi:FdrA protein